MAYQPKSYRKFLATSVAAAVVVTAGAASVAGATKFSDVPANHFAVDHINYLVEKGAISGYADGTFKPNASITRAELSRILVDTLGLEVEENVQLSFTDTRDDAWYAPYVAALADKGIIQGNPDGTFAPGKTVTRAELAIMVVAAYELEAGDKEVAFPDVKENVWYTDAINTLASNNIVVGKPDGSFAPGDAVTRGEATAFVHRTEDPTVRPGHEDDKELTVESVTVVDATTLTVVLSDDTTHEVTLEEALEANVETEVTFEIDGVEYTATVTWEVEEDGALAVESVSAIEATIVEVTFAELDEELTDVTVEVTDSKGVVREVIARDIAKGATTAQFDFATTITADDLEGVWTVNGVSYSFDELKLVEDIVAEAGKSPVNQVKLYSLLQEAGIENVDADRIATYADDINSATTTPVWASDIQKIVDQTNKDAGDAASEAAIVKAVADATNQIQLLPVLQANFDRVNPNWIAGYATQHVDPAGVNETMLALNADNYVGKDDAVTKAQIQAAIDAVNNTNIGTANTNADTSTKQAAVTSLIETYVQADNPATPNVTPKADAIAASKAKEAAFRVAEATTENSLYNALVLYANATPDATLKASELNANLKAYYKSAFDTHTKASLVSEIKAGTVDIKGDIVEQADTNALEDALNTVGTTATAYDADKTNATKKAAFSKALQTLANYTSHQTVTTEKFVMSTIDNALLEDYANVLTGIDSTDAVSDVQDAVKGVNDNKELVAAVKVVNNTASTATQVRTALTTIAVAEGNTSFINLSATAKLEVAELVIEDRPTDGFEAVEGDGVVAPQTVVEVINTEITAQISARSSLIANINAVNGTDQAPVSFDFDTVNTALTALDHEAYNALTGLARINAAQNFFDNMPTRTLTDGTVVEVAYTTLTAIKADIDKAIAE